MLAHFRSKFKHVSSERGESLPAAIVTGIVSSIILLGLASVMATIVTQQKNAQITAEATTSATNIDVSLRSDSTAATSITALSAHSVNFHIPSIQGSECKLVVWNVNGTSLNRHLTVYADTKTVGSIVKCDTASVVIVSNNRTLSDKIEDGSTFNYANALNRSLTVSGPGTMTPSDPSQSPPNDDPATEAAWASTKISKISYAFKIIPETGSNVFRSIEQSASTPLYSTPAEKADAETGLANAATPSQINPVRVSVNPIVLGSGYTVSWDAVSCPADTVRSYTLYENGVAQTLTANGINKTQTNQALKTVAYKAVTTCVRGALAISGPESPTVSVNVVPPAPTLGITKKPSVSNATLNAPLSASAVCAYGSPRYNLEQASLSFGNRGTITNLTSITDRPINTGMTTYEGTTYDYRVTSWCVTTSNTVSTNTSTSTGNFSTLMTMPARTTVTVPTTAMLGANYNVTWTSAVCPASWNISYRVYIANSYIGARSDTATVHSNTDQSIASRAYTVDTNCVRGNERHTSAISAADTIAFTVPAPSFSLTTEPAVTNAAINSTIAGAATCAYGSPRYTLNQLTTSYGAAGARTATLTYLNRAINAGYTVYQGTTYQYQGAAWCLTTATTTSTTVLDNTSAFKTVMTTPARPTVTAPATAMLGAVYTVSWTAAYCPASWTLQYRAYVDNANFLSGTAVSTSQRNTNQAISKKTYSADSNCVRGSERVTSARSAGDLISYTVPAPSLTIYSQPAATGAALNSNITAGAACAYGSPRYTLSRDASTYGALGTTGALTSVNRSINSDFTTYQGSRYTYGVDAWCLTTAATTSAITARSTNSFVTTISTPAAPTWVSPAAAATKVATTVNADWNPVACAAGTTATYYVEKNRQYNAAITAVKVYGGTAATAVSVTNLEGNTVGYAVKALCDGSAVNSSYSSANQLNFTTLVTAPSVALSVRNNGWATMVWAAPTTKCATGVTLKYRLYQTKNNNIAGNWATAWGNYLSAVLPVEAARAGASYQGYPHWGFVQTYCDGVNADSSAVGSQATSGSKWVAGMAVSLSGGLSSWRKFSVNASCPVGSKVGTFYMYVAASGWNGSRYGTTIQTDEGANIAAARAGAGGNSGWLRVDQTVNTQWVDDGDSSHYWGYWGQGGYGAIYDSGKRTMKGTYWNASAWGTFAWYWTGNCSTPYKIVYDRGGADANTGANKGDPWSHWSHWTNNPRTEQTAAGNTAVQ